MHTTTPSAVVFLCLMAQWGHPEPVSLIFSLHKFASCLITLKILLCLKSCQPAIMFATHFLNDFNYYALYNQATSGQPRDVNWDWLFRLGTSVSG